jgi:hypothetical protein
MRITAFAGRVFGLGGWTSLLLGNNVRDFSATVLRAVASNGAK